MDYRLIPYTAVDGIPTLPDSFIKGLFVRMADEGLIGDVFYDGSASTPNDFLALMKFGKNHLNVIECDGKIGGCCWLNNFEKRRADFHFCFFSNLRGKDAVEIGKKVVVELLTMKNADGEYIFDLLVGLTPTNNAAAIRWCRRMEFETLGILPAAAWDAAENKSVPGLISYVERGKYDGKRRKHHNDDE